MKFMIALLLVLNVLLTLLLVERRKSALMACQASLEEMTNTFNGCLTSYNFIEAKLSECRGETPWQP